MSKLTQRELAAHLGLSYATVSRAFNGDGRVTEATRQRVLREAEALGFRGHSLARALRLKRSFAIGMVGTSSPHSYWADSVAALERRAREAGYHVIISHRPRGADSSDSVRFLLEREVDALIVAPNPGGEEPAVLREAAEENKPLLLFNNRLPYFPAHYLGTDSRTGSRRACEYLLGLGHRRIAFISGAEGDSTADSRLAGYREALAAAGLAVDPRYVLPGGWDKADGERAAVPLLELSPRPTAAMAANDPAAFGLYLALRRAGVRVPEDMSLVGYSGDQAGELLATPLTTVLQPVEELGRRAAELVLELVDGKHASLVSEELPDRLLIRASCGAPITRP